ncbi:tripartite motif-containing protein 29-like [Mya arenaria]|uniref:tripartite motif-containing protein 29-like n=1 Tax=Mya arenaria TaxID=6604 RepID=UPI0022E0236C|nr:tripartite motif-containing protein 29-like [Mya arenaria]
MAECKSECWCSMCKGNGEHSHAKFSCATCKAYYCELCEPVHARLFLQHSRSKAEHLGKSSFEKCETHSEEYVDCYCMVHNQLCCSKCKSATHRECTLILSLEDAVYAIAIKDDDLKECLAELDKMKNKVRQLKGRRKQKQRQSLHHRFSNIPANIKVFRRKINKIIDQMEKRTIEQINVVIESLDDESSADIDRSTTYVEDCKAVFDYVQRKDDISGAGSLIAFKKSKLLISKMNDFLLETQLKNDIPWEFEPEMEIVEYLSLQHRLGVIREKSEYAINSVETEYVDARLPNDKKKCEKRKEEYVNCLTEK